MELINSIQHRIYRVRGHSVILDFDLAALYDVPTKALNQAVKRNPKRFPEDFMFQLSIKEWQSIRSQFVTASKTESVAAGEDAKLTLGQRKRNASSRPFAFTEQGVAMLSGVLNSDRAIEMNITIMRAFISLRRLLAGEQGRNKAIRQIIERLDEHDVQLSQIYDALENMLDEKAEKHKWEDRERIGFKK